jgi:hypothetical protein
MLQITKVDLEEFASQRDAVANEINCIAEAAGISAIPLASGLCALPEGTTEENINRALWGTLMTDLDLVVGVCLHRHCKARWKAKIPHSSMMRN